ncbi:hypothetical protein [Halorubellus litoreus]|uniref:Halobacterial output domain-containing protein n=1 Tax=Halorubellus litoreus TaxID=755308 RepID=A0ABD5VH91_9EURY
MSTTTQTPDAASTGTEHDAPLDWSAFTLTASGPATRLAVDDDATWCEQTETTLHVKRTIDDYDDLLAFVDVSRSRQTRYFESSETNRRDDRHDDVVDTLFEEASDDHHLGDHHAEDWTVQIQASLSAWTDLYNSLHKLDDAVDDTHSSRLDRLETFQEHDVPGPTLDIVCAVAATHCGNDYKQTDHLIAYTDATNTSERLTVAE